MSDVDLIPAAGISLDFLVPNKLRAGIWAPQIPLWPLDNVLLMLICLPLIELWGVKYFEEFEGAIID